MWKCRRKPSWPSSNSMEINSPDSQVFCLFSLYLEDDSKRAIIVGSARDAESADFTSGIDVCADAGADIVVANSYDA